MANSQSHSLGTGIQTYVYLGCSQPKMILPLRIHLAMSGDTFDCHNWGDKVCGATGI